jgi:hypothetical protein
MSKTYKGDVTGNVVELNLLDANEGTLPNLGTPTVVTRNTGPNDVTQVVGDITSSNGFANDSTLKGLVIGTSCTNIGSSSFYYCNGLTGDLVIPDSVTNIEGGSYTGAFLGSTFNGTLTIGNSVTSIGDYAFYLCYGLTGSLTIPDSVTSIGYYAFGNCEALNGDLVIPSSVTNIGIYAFFYCTGLTALYTNTPAASWVGGNALGFTTALVNIYTGPNATGYDATWKSNQGTTATVSTWTNYPNIP